MKEIHNDKVVEISQSKRQESSFDPDKRVAIVNRPVNGNFTDEDKAAMEQGIKLYGNEDFKDTRIGDRWEYPENDYTYKTDNQGRIVHAEAIPLKEKPRDERIPHNSQSPDKVNGDDAGHIIGDQFGGSPDIDNIVSQEAGLNRGEYKKLETYFRNQIKDGNKVECLYDLKYEDVSRRPSDITVSYRINDGDWCEQIFINTIKNKVV